MTRFYDISAWNERTWFQTGGTRDKMVVENPDDHSVYYFKTSLKRVLVLSGIIRTLSDNFEFDGFTFNLQFE